MFASPKRPGKTTSLTQLKRYQVSVASNMAHAHAVLWFFYIGNGIFIQDDGMLGRCPSGPKIALSALEDHRTMRNSAIERAQSWKGGQVSCNRMRGALFFPIIENATLQFYFQLLAPNSFMSRASTQRSNVRRLGIFNFAHGYCAACFFLHLLWCFS